VVMWFEKLLYWTEKKRVADRRTASHEQKKRGKRKCHTSKLVNVSHYACSQGEIKKRGGDSALQVCV